MRQFNMIKPEGNILIAGEAGGVGDFATTAQRTPIEILKSMLAFLSEGRIADFVAEVHSQFTFTDHALDLQFSEKTRLTEFLQKSRELFPDTVIEVRSAFQSGDRAIAAWKLTQTEHVSIGSMKLRFPISLSGVSIVRFNKEKVTHWSDYYDQSNGRRAGISAIFKEWIEY